MKKNINFFKDFEMSKVQASHIVGGLGCQWSDGGAVTSCGGGGGSCQVNVYSSGKRCLTCGGNEGSCRNDLTSAPGTGTSMSMAGSAMLES